MSFENLVLKAKANSLSLNMGYVGIGKGGCEIAARCASEYSYEVMNRFPYSATLFYTGSFVPDVPKLINPHIKKVELEDEEYSAGISLEEEERVATRHESLIKKEIMEQTRSLEFLWITIDLNSDIGAGFGKKLLSFMGNKGKNPIGFILKLPYLSASKEILFKALSFLQSLEKRKKHFGAIIYIKPSQKETTSPKALMKNFEDEQVNELAGLLHQLNFIFKSYYSRRAGRFNPGDFYYLLRDSGHLQLVRIKFPANEIDTLHPHLYMHEMNNRIREGGISGGYDYAGGTQSAICVLASEKRADQLYNVNFSNQLHEILTEHNPVGKIRSTAYYTHQLKEERDYVYFYVLISGLTMREYIKKMARKYQDQQQ